MTRIDPLTGQLTILDEEADRAWCAYVAGLVDGEGYVGLKSRGGFAPPLPIVEVSMCEPAAVLELHERYGGSCYVDACRRGDARDIQRWRVSGRGCVAPLRDVLPFLRVKRKQAVIVLGIARGVGHGRVTGAERFARVRAYHELRELNRKGRAREP